MASRRTSCLRTERFPKRREIRHFPALFSSAECAYLIEAAAPILQPSVVVDPRTGSQVPNPVRTSSAAGFPFTDENPAIHALNRRLAAASGTDVRAGEPLQVLRYAPGQQYREHSDALPGVAAIAAARPDLPRLSQRGYRRRRNVLPRLGLKVRGRTGDGLLFRNASADGQARSSGRSTPAGR